MHQLGDKGTLICKKSTSLFTKNNCIKNCLADLERSGSMRPNINPAYAIAILLRPKTAAKSKLLLFHHQNLRCFSHKNSAFIAVLALTTNPIAYAGINKNKPSCLSDSSGYPAPLLVSISTSHCKGAE